MLFDEIADSITKPFDIEVAIWFHDAIYYPMKNDNEKMSSNYAKVFLESIRLDSIKIREIEHLILLTKHPSTPITSDEKYLIDIDLSILGTKCKIYNNYELQIREEYILVPDSLYIEGRKKVLNSFVKLDNIFQTKYFYEKYETKARQNINLALKQLY